VISYWSPGRCLLPAVLALMSISAVKAVEPGAAFGGTVNHSLIDGSALSSVHGAVAVNQAAGDFNQQSNAAAIAISAIEVSPAGIQIRQRTQANEAGAPGIDEAHITGRAFANTSGWIAINQASGASNAQANNLVIGVGIRGEEATESILAQVLPATESASTGAANEGVRAVSIDNTAFEGARGIVQVNQSAGVGNATANNFAFRIVDANP
jgi:hypothetical protein